MGSSWRASQRLWRKRWGEAWRVKISASRLLAKCSRGVCGQDVELPNTTCNNTSNMGRYDFRPLRVRQMAKALFDSKRDPDLPQWYEVLGNIPPSETLARPVMRIPKMRKARKASKLFKPLPIAYPEDKLRSEFFGDHPWELTRPRLVVENSGNDAKGYDWSNIVQAGKQLDGERCIILMYT